MTLGHNQWNTSGTVVSSLSDSLAQLSFALASLALQGDLCGLKPTSVFTGSSIYSFRKVESMPGNYLYRGPVLCVWQAGPNSSAPSMRRHAPNQALKCMKSWKTFVRSPNAGLAVPFSSSHLSKAISFPFFDLLKGIAAGACICFMGGVATSGPPWAATGWCRVQDIPSTGGKSSPLHQMVMKCQGGQAALLLLLPWEHCLAFAHGLALCLWFRGTRVLIAH